MEGKLGQVRNQEWMKERNQDERFAIIASAKRHGVPLEILVGVLRTETAGFSQAAVSEAGAVGVCQLTRDGSIAQLGGDFERAKHDWRYNLKLGTAYLAYCRNGARDWKHAIVRYNWGATIGKNWQGDVASLPSETQNYLRKVFV